MNITYIINNINPDLIPEFDPRNPPRTVPGGVDYDQTSPDAQEIIEKLKDCTRESDLRRIIWEAFLDQFKGEIAGDRDSAEYRDAVFDVWRYYAR